MLQVDWWDQPVGNRTLSRLWAQQQKLKPAPPLGDWDPPARGTFAERAVTPSDNDTVAITLAAAPTGPRAAPEAASAFVHVLLPLLARNISTKADNEGLRVVWKGDSSWLGVPIVAQAGPLVEELSAPSTSVVVFAEADQIPVFSHTVARWRDGAGKAAGAKVYVADAGRSHGLLPMLGLVRTDVPAAVVCIGGRWDLEKDVAKELSPGSVGEPDERLTALLARAAGGGGADATGRTSSLRMDHPAEHNALTRPAWMAESRWVIRKRDIDRLCRGRAAARAAHTHGGHPTICLFLFDRQRDEDEHMGQDTYDRILDEALRSVAAMQPGWKAAWEPIFVPTGIGGGGFGWPTGARDAAMRLGMGHRSPPFVAAWDPEWEKDGRWASVYPPSPGYERKDWRADSIAQWLAEVDGIAGTNPPAWWWAMLTNPATLIIGGIVICAIWLIVSAVLRSQYDATKGYKWE